MKKLRVLGLIGMVAVSLAVAACNKSETKQVDVVDQSKFVQPFNSSESFVKLFSEPSFDFNSQLPLVGPFTSILNLISNNADSVLMPPKDKNADQAVEEFAKTLNQEYKKDLTAYLELPAKEREAYEAKGISINKDSQLKTLIDQLNSSCLESDNFRPKIDEVLSKIDYGDLNADDKTSKMNDTKAFLNKWTAIINNTCLLTKKLDDKFKEPDFDMKSLDDGSSN